MKKFCNSKNCCKGKKCYTVAGIIILLVLVFCFSGCQNYDDQFDDLNAEIAALKMENSRLEELIKTKAEATAVIDLLNERSNQLISYVQDYADGVAGALENQSAYLIGELTKLQEQIDAIEIPSIDGLASDQDINDTESLIEDVTSDLADLQAELNDLAAEVADIEPTVVVTTAWSPVFDVQTENFTQTTTSTIEDIVIDTNEREIFVYGATPTSTTVTSTVIEVGRSNVAGISSDTLNDAVVSQTTTNTIYTFHIEDADASSYEHTVSATSSWTLN